MKYKVVYRVYLSDNVSEELTTIVDAPKGTGVQSGVSDIIYAGCGEHFDFEILSVTPLNVLKLLQGPHTRYCMAEDTEYQRCLSRMNEGKIEPLYLFEVTIGAFRTYVLSPTDEGAISQAACNPACNASVTDSREAVRLAYMIRGWSGETF